MKTKKETKCISENVNIMMEVDIYDGIDMDTRVILNGEFWIRGEERKEFTEILSELIDKYRI